MFKFVLIRYWFFGFFWYNCFDEQILFSTMLFLSLYFSSVQSLNHVRLFVTWWTAKWQASLSLTNSQSLLKLMSSESVMPSSNFILCNPLLLLPSIFPSIRAFQMSQFFASGGQKYCSFSFSISPSDEYSGLICFRMDWLDLLAVQGTLKSLLQHYSSKALILWNLYLLSSNCI